MDADLPYLDRVADDELEHALKVAGAVLIEGPKAAGKTSTAWRHASTVVSLDDDLDADIADALATDPDRLLAGPTPVLLDEWQLVEVLWNRVRRAVDARGGRPGQFILTGSSTPDDSVRRHSGAGRFRVLAMRPMSLFESGHSSGQVSLASLFRGEQPDGFNPDWTASSAREAMAERIVTGGWPANVRLPAEVAAERNDDYLSLICEYDLHRVDGKHRDPGTAAKVIRSYARHVATPASQRTIAADTVEADSSPEDTTTKSLASPRGADATSRETVADHLAALTRLRIVEEQPGWAPSLRSSRRPRTTPKRHFVDPCLAAASLGAGPEHLLADPRLFGLWFESLAVRDLRVYAQPLGGRVYYYRDDRRLEADAVIELRDGRWAAVEVKLGHTTSVIDGAAENLLELRDRVDSNRCAFLAVLTNSGRAYRRRDAVDVIPLTMLGP